MTYSKNTSSRRFTTVGGEPQKPDASSFPRFLLARGLSTRDFLGAASPCSVILVCVCRAVKVFFVRTESSAGPPLISACTFYANAVRLFIGSWRESDKSILMKIFRETRLEQKKEKNGERATSSSSSSVALPRAARVTAEMPLYLYRRA